MNMQWEITYNIVTNVGEEHTYGFIESAIADTVDDAFDKLIESLKLDETLEEIVFACAGHELKGFKINGMTVNIFSIRRIVDSSERELIHYPPFRKKIIQMKADIELMQKEASEKEARRMAQIEDNKIVNLNDYKKSKES